VNETMSILAVFSDFQPPSLLLLLAHCIREKYHFKTCVVFH